MPKREGVSNPKIVAYFRLKMPSASSKLQRLDLRTKITTPT